MTSFLYKPHIAGPKNNITTPDIIIDRVSVTADSASDYVPIQRLSSTAELQTVMGELLVTPAYVMAAAGAGVVVAPGALIRGADHPANTADLLVARMAWRLKNLVTHFSSVELTATIDYAKGAAKSDQVSASGLTKPEEVLKYLGGNKDDLPRGIMVFCVAPQSSFTMVASASVTIQLEDKQLGRSLSHRTDLVSVTYDRWDQRPLPRYTVGPVGEVEHYV
jgi:hypothetical protein